MLGLPAFGFADPGPLRDELTAAVLAGQKTATASLVADFLVDGSPLPTVGGRSVVYDSERRPVAIIETTAVRLATIATVADDFARDEGEGFRDATDWRVAHERYWDGHLAAYRAGLDDPGFALTDDTPVVCEWFRLVSVVQGAGTTDSVTPPGAGSGPAATLTADQRAFIGEARTATLGTIGRGGRPRLVPICFALGPDGTAVPSGPPILYSPLDEKPKSTADPNDLARVRDLRARPEATLLIERWSEDWTRIGWIRLECMADVLAPAGSRIEDALAAERGLAISALRERYPQYATHRLEERPLLRFAVERVVAWGRISPIDPAA